MNYLKQSFVLVALLSSWAAGPLFGEDAGYFQSTGGMNVYIGILPAEMIKDYPIVHQGRESTTTREQHLIVTLTDQESGQRIEDVDVTARLVHEGHAGSFRPLEPMYIADTITYGNFFSFPAEGGYSIQLRINRAGESITEVEFRHRHVME